MYALAPEYLGVVVAASALIGPAVKCLRRGPYGSLALQSIQHMHEDCAVLYSLDTCRGCTSGPWHLAKRRSPWRLLDLIPFAAVSMNAIRQNEARLANGGTLVAVPGH